MASTDHLIDKNVIYGGDYVEHTHANSIGEIILNYLEEKKDRIILVSRIDVKLA